ncbi:inositol 2-dehydrogenase [Paenibacillus glycanilyticus]|uniref:Inositol 2-dehydrogenase n=1 Tax=Paenibacillus glycanilyticus TaxID=126569 RepID=A0ABQ6GAE6_9BACL|nr:inositol 2-dehydrogenase [Paenibacillus glycanilyticus]GLX66561.1 inositol 2-dehydrogenase [Paenibacillus glycanilyticus]
MNKVRVGIIGAGRIGKIHADNLLRMGEAEVVAISDLCVSDELMAWASARGIGMVTSDSSEVIAHPDVDAIYICSSTDTHVPLIIQSAEAGKHVFCEKPVSMDVNRTREALEAVKKAGVKLQIGFNRRFDHNFKRLRQLVAEDRIGMPHLVKITSRDPNPPSPAYIQVSGGIFMDMAIHDFDMARYLSGSEVDTVFAQGAVLVDPVIGELGDYDTAVITLTFDNGALAVIDNSRRAVYGYDQRVEVFGSRGAVSAENDYPNTVTLSDETGVVRDKPLHFFLERYNEAYMEETKMFIDSVLHNRPLPVEGYDGLQAELIALAAKQSAKLGRPIRLSELT